jgi:hypothetical protein
VCSPKIAKIDEPRKEMGPKIKILCSPEMDEIRKEDEPGNPSISVED